MKRLCNRVGLSYRFQRTTDADETRARRFARLWHHFRIPKRPYAIPEKNCVGDEPIALGVIGDLS